MRFWDLRGGEEAEADPYPPAPFPVNGERGERKQTPPNPPASRGESEAEAPLNPPKSADRFGGRPEGFFRFLLKPSE